ncbi:RecQ family ATP-dependent DNA helicase [Desulfosporosinus sp. BICA1-9]|uniref:RecQ family ATP-dependent DNA helicase n=1 Tax=Desulfosporosinus sp. BICA1-9 TaxID=1531958 RepID=UPI000A6D1BCE
MRSIAFIDTEVEPNSRRILDIGSVKGDGSSFHSTSVADFIKFLHGSKYVCGHNIFNHDLKYIHHAIHAAEISDLNAIDTLFLSPLLFPTKPYHALLKDDKLQTDDTNNPLNDSIKAKDLFFDEVSAFQQTSNTLKQIFYYLLKDKKEFYAAVANKSLLSVFPTGGGKSITFQVPALMSGINSRGLTVVISPLQSLMKDQVDNLEKLGITDAVTINGLLDPIERAKSFERVEDGSASILYISPESLRSRTIERLLLGRNVVRFVIDEAHCFSSWGQDFRVDYLYIGDFIKSLQKKKNIEDGIPVSCFTATAKQKVIEDIRDYFKEKLSLDLEVYSSSASRTNLRYNVIEKEGEEEKYNTVRNLIEEKNCPTIIYVSRTKRAYSLAQRLTEDGYQAKPYHGQMEKKEKTENQDAFIRGKLQIMVATSAFGMGVDKKDVGMVIHYDISDSL